LLASLDISSPELEGYVILSENFMILWLTTVHENSGAISLLDKEGPGVVDRRATTP